MTKRLLTLAFVIFNCGVPSLFAQTQSATDSAYDSYNKMLASPPQTPREVFYQLLDKEHKLHDKATTLKKQGDIMGAWEAFSEMVQLDPAPLDARVFCHYSFDAGKYRDVVWCGQRIMDAINADKVNAWMMDAPVQMEWGISLAVLGDYRKADSVLVDGIEKLHTANSDFGYEKEWLDYYREWHYTLNYINNDFSSTLILAEKDNTIATDGHQTANLYNLLARDISHLVGLAQGQGMNYPLLSHWSALHRLVREDMVVDYAFDKSESQRSKNEGIVTGIAWHAIDVYNGLPLKPLPPADVAREYQDAMNVIATKPYGSWYDAIQKLIDVTRRVPWWAEVHYNLASILKTDKVTISNYYCIEYTGANIDNKIVAQELIFYLALEPNGEKAGEAKKILRSLNQQIPGE
ncbi:hypothetical protein [Mucilaginibacter sp. OK098]|uniref:hypothetical protein n=1 Tax=Mucilaginibacter sp. OK098 TaxID=1855297 RepID=UPI001160FC9D|nr:hypothetical protein [Mucilaginibacter sp. OK098]